MIITLEKVQWAHNYACDEFEVDKVDVGETGWRLENMNSLYYSTRNSSPETRIWGFIRDLLPGSRR